MNLSDLENENDLDEKAFTEQFGGKANGLRLAHQMGLPVPKTWMVPSALFVEFLEQYPKVNQEHFVEEARRYIEGNLHLDLKEQSFAIRSSAPHEDSLAKSYAGIFDTHLDVAVDAIPEAIAKVWSSVYSCRASSYNLEEEGMAVLIQPMVESKFAGVCFSKHPSPTNVMERDFCVVEYARARGDEVVSGSVKPTRLMGVGNDLVSQSKEKWVEKLVKAQEKLKCSLGHEVDIEFAVDEDEHLWLLQQRPISQVAATHTLDLTNYDRRYKRQMMALDIELLIDGCSRYLPKYFGFKFNIDPWMVMTTGSNAQELWLEKDYDKAIVEEVQWKIETDPKYLKHMHALYHEKHKALYAYDYSHYAEGDTPLDERFEAWYTMMGPNAAHYYVPMFMLDALHTLLLEQMSEIDPKQAKQDLYDIGTYGVHSLYEELENELRSQESFSQEELEVLSRKYGFLNCHQPYMYGYSGEEIAQIKASLKEKEVVDQRMRIDQLRKKYEKMPRANELLDAFWEWMRIRNQDMEYYYYACNASHPLMKQVAKALECDEATIWASSFEEIMTALQTETAIMTPTQNVAIYRLGSRTVVNHGMKLKHPVQEEDSLKGDVVVGEGQVEATVKIVFDPEELKKIEHGPIVCVTGMTSPDFIPHMNKHIVALVTDEGGILCHAAIVAREMGIPTIVGASFATDTLKDGDKVLLDFDHGLIKSLSN